MKISLRGYSLILLSSAFLVLFSGCQGLQSREALKEQEQKKELTDKFSTLQKTTADNNSKYSDIEDEIRSLRGHVETVENKGNVNEAALSQSKKQTEEQLNEMQKKYSVMQDDILKMHDQITTLAGELAASKAEKESVQIQTSGFDGAESYFEKKDWKKAILAYQKFREAKPKDKRVPEAIYKIGVCFQELGMKDEAKTFYDDLLGKYPTSTSAKKAKSRLKTLSTK